MKKADEIRLWKKVFWLSDWFCGFTTSAIAKIFIVLALPMPNDANLANHIIKWFLILWAVAPLWSRVALENLRVLQNE